MDFSSGLLWSEINDILMNNFHGELEHNESRIEMVQMMQSIINFQEQFGKETVSVLLSGSFAETTNMNPLVRREAEFDFMIVPRNFIISRDMQPAIFKDIPDEPGFVRLEAPNTLESEILEIKQVIHSGGRSRFYIVPNWTRLGTRFQNRPQSSKNILLQSIYDSLQTESMLALAYQKGPAFTGCLNGFMPTLELIADDPKNTLFKFLGHLGTRVLEHIDDNKPERRGIRKSNEKLKNNNFGETVDFMTTRPKQMLAIDVLMMDMCPAIKCEGWPHKALRFFHRTRVWPDQAMLNKLLQSGFHLVYKPLNPLAQDSVEWRISFTQAEISLFENMDAFRLSCYRIFKAIYYFELTLPKVLCSYHMKTIFLWACERIPSEMWVESNWAQIIMGLLDDLLHCLVTKSCPNYFIPENNLFAHVHQDFLDRLAKVVTKIRRNPERYLSVLKVKDIADQDTEVDKEDVSMLDDIELD